MDILKLTPVEIHNNIFVKRDDLFKPFNNIPLNGGKLRQAFKLLENNKDIIKNKYNNTVVTATSLTSPQGLIISKVAEYYNMNCIVFIGNTNETVIQRNNMIREVNKIATIKYCKAGYNSVLTKHSKDLCNDKNYFLVNYGINIIHDKKAILKSVSLQVENIPNYLDYLVVPIGSGITFTGILLGLQKYHKNVKHMVGIQISGHNYKNKIRNNLGLNQIPFEFYVSKNFDYSKKVKHKIGDLYLDEIYESKAWDYFINNFDYKNKKVCFWIIGNTIDIRNYR